MIIIAVIKSGIFHIDIVTLCDDVLTGIGGVVPEHGGLLGCMGCVIYSYLF